MSDAHQVLAPATKPKAKPKPKVAVNSVPERAPAAKPSKVIIASKMPMGVELQHSRMQVVQRKFRETMWQETEAQRVGPVVRVRGTAYPQGQPPEGFRDRPVLIAGYALTFNIDREWWEEWARQNKDTEMVQNGLIFAAGTSADISSRARKEFSDVDSGLGPLVPDTDRRLPRSIKGIEIKGEPGPTDAELAEASS